MGSRRPADSDRDLDRYRAGQCLDDTRRFDFGTGGYLLPLWLALLWAVLGTTLNHCLAWTAKPLWRAVVLGAIGGPMSYYAGSQLAQVHLPLGCGQACWCWAWSGRVYFPCCNGWQPAPPDTRENRSERYTHSARRDPRRRTGSHVFDLRSLLLPTGSDADHRHGRA